jgi:Ras-related GTP-binding protein A/B
MSINCLPTSIWDETLYKAWSEIVYRLIPNIGHIESLLQKFCQIAGADEVVLFEVRLHLPSSLHAADGDRVSVGTLNNDSRVTLCSVVLGPQRETFLFICHTSLREYKDIHRFENISNIVKNFKLSCRYFPFLSSLRALARPRHWNLTIFLLLLLLLNRKTSAHFINMEVRNSQTSVFIDAFTQNTYILVVLSDPSIRTHPPPWDSALVHVLCSLPSPFMQRPPSHWPTSRRPCPALRSTCHLINKPSLLLSLSLSALLLPLLL